MKKFFSLLCAVAIVFSASAVPAKKVAMLDKSAAKEFQTQKIFGANKMDAVSHRSLKSPKAVKDVTFNVSTDSIKAFQAKVIVNPSDANALYYFSIIEKAVADTMTDASIVSNIKSTFDYYIMMYSSYYGMELTYADFLSQGDDAYMFKDLEAETAYTIFVFQMDENANLVGAVTRVNFSTAAFEASGVSIPVSISGLKFLDHVADQGWWQIMGYSADSTYFVSFSNAEAVEAIVGSYDFADMDPEYSMFYIGEEEIEFVSGTIVVSQNQDGTYHVVATLLAKDGNEYVLTLDSKLQLPSENVITLSYADGVVSIATTNSDSYFYYMETKEEYDKYEADFSQASVNEETDAWIATAAQYSVLSYYTASGNLSVDVAEFLGNYNAEGEYVFLAAPVDDGDRNGEAVYLLFTYTWPEAIDNTEVEIKANKVIRNGQLFIEKNGVKYNAQGAVVK